MAKRNTRSDRQKRKLPAPNERRELRVRNPAPELDLREKKKWFLIFTAPRAEAKVEAGLKEAGCSTFWPSEHRTITRGQKITYEGDVATFPRYLFAHGPLLDGEKPDAPLVVKGKPITGVFDIDGIQSIVSDQKGWVRVPNAAIRAIAAYQNAVEPPKAPRPDITPGAQLVITSGPFMSFNAVVVEALGIDQARVMVKLFGGPAPVTISVDSLRAA